MTEIKELDQRMRENVRVEDKASRIEARPTVSERAIRDKIGHVLPNPYNAPAPFTNIGLVMNDQSMVARFELRAAERNRWWQLESVKISQEREWVQATIER